MSTTAWKVHGDLLIITCPYFSDFTSPAHSTPTLWDLFSFFGKLFHQSDDCWLLHDSAQWGLPSPSCIKHEPATLPHTLNFTYFALIFPQNVSTPTFISILYLFKVLRRTVFTACILSLACNFLRLGVFCPFFFSLFCSVSSFKHLEQCLLECNRCSMNVCVKNLIYKKRQDFWQQLPEKWDVEQIEGPVLDKK